MADKDKKKNDEENNDNPYDFFKLSVDNDNDDKNKKKPQRPNGMPIWLIILIILGFLVIFNLMFPTDNSKTIGFSDFQNKVKNGEITRVEIGDNSVIGYVPYKMTVTVSPTQENSSVQDEEVTPINTEEKEALPQSSSKKKSSSLPFLMKHSDLPKEIVYSSTIEIGLMDNFVSLLDEKGVTYRFVHKQTGFILGIIINLLPFIVLIIIYIAIARKMGGGGVGGIGSVLSNGSRSKAIEEGKVKTRFSDVAGVDEAKEELVEVVDFLKQPKKYTDIGGKIPKGVLLVGPPGTGKTLLARAVAGEAGVPFFRISGSDFVEMFVGVGASRVRDLFRQAREKAPCIIFIDELDAIGKSRVNNLGGNDEREQTLNQLLVEMDGFDNEKGLIILAATNRADILDPALLRPGRFDRQVPVERPDVKGREAILRIHAKNVKLDSDVDFTSIAHGTIGFAGADLANVINEAALLAVRNGRKKVTMADMNEAIDKVSIGLKKKTKPENEKERKLVAVHETGHALVGAFTEGYPPVNKITVVPRSHGVGGFTQYREEEEKTMQTQRDLINEVDSLLGGRAAEQVEFGEVSTGASNDIARATEIVKRMIVDFGMSDKFKNMTLGKGVLGNRGGEPTIVREFSEETQKYVDEEIARVMAERYKYVVKLLTGHKELLEYVSNRLLEIETMDGKEFYDIVNAEKHTAEITAKAKKSASTVKKTSGIKKTRAVKAE